MVQNTIINALTKHGLNNYSQYILLYCSDDIKKLTSFLVDSLIDKIKYVFTINPVKVIKIIITTIPYLLFKPLMNFKKLIWKNNKSKKLLEKNCENNNYFYYYINKKNNDGSYNIYFNSLIDYFVKNNYWKNITSSCIIERISRDIENQLYEIKNIQFDINNIKINVVFDENKEL
jgi:hypothetical protein